MSDEDDIDDDDDFNDDDDDDYYDRDLGAGQCNHESDAKAIFWFRSEDLLLSHSSLHHSDLFFYQQFCQIYQ